MKNLVTSIILTVALSASLSASARATDNQNLTLCKASVRSELSGVKRIKVAKIRSHRGVFHAKFRVVYNGQRSIVLCKLDKEQAVVISCVRGNACEASNLAGN